MFTQGGRAAVSAALRVAGSGKIAPESALFIRGGATAVGC